MGTLVWTASEALRCPDDNCRSFFQLRVRGEYSQQKTCQSISGKHSNRDRSHRAQCSDRLLDGLLPLRGELVGRGDRVGTGVGRYGGTLGRVLAAT